MRKKIIFLFCIVLLFLNAEVSDAYDCLPPPPPKKALQFSDCVFVGKVKRHEFEDARDTNWTNNRNNYIQRVRYYFEVEQIWKGTTTKEIAIVSAPNGECGYSFLDGKRYIVYANKSRWGLTDKDSSRLVTGFGRTNSIEGATEDLKELGEGQIIK